MFLQLHLFFFLSRYDEEEITADDYEVIAEGRGDGGGNAGAAFGGMSAFDDSPGNKT